METSVNRIQWSALDARLSFNIDSPTEPDANPTVGERHFQGQDAMVNVSIHFYKYWCVDENQNVALSQYLKNSNRYNTGVQTEQMPIDELCYPAIRQL